MLEREIGQGITFENKKVGEESAKILSTHFEQEALERDLRNEDLKKSTETEGIKEVFMEEIAFGLMITMSKIPIQQIGIQRVSHQPTSGREVQKNQH